MKRVVILLFCSVFYLFTLAQSVQWTSFKNDSISDNEEGLPVVSVENAVVTAGEHGGCYMVLFFSLSKRSKDPVKVQFHTASNTGSGEEDYLQKRGKITFPSNRLLQTIKVPVDCEVHNKPDHTFFVKLSGAVNATPENLTVIGTINNASPIKAVSLNKFHF